jgi:NTE family protein
MRRLASASLALLLAIPPLPGRAEEPAPPARRPKIGLVLSGGGARGAAHIGVLKVLQRLHIPVDIVVGTSMGSVVGGLYATGLSPEEIDKFFRTFNWNESFANAPPRDELSFRRKEDTFRYLIGYGIGVRGFQMRFPLGITTGQVFLGELRALGGMTQVYPSFHDLPIPFSCVATDLIQAVPVVLDKGDLALSIRASASVAPMFAPVVIDGRTLVDGGYMNNIPVDVARAMGADRVIVVDIGTPLQTKKDLISIFDVFNQTSRLGGAEFDRQTLKTLTSKDLLITPDLHDMNFIDFALIPQAIVWGEEAANAAESKLRSFSVSEQAYEKSIESRRPRRNPEVVIDEIDIQSDANFGTNEIRHMIRQLTGQPLNLRQLQQDLMRVNGLGYFDIVDYNVVEKDGKHTLVIRAPRLYWGPGNFRFGLELADDFNTVSLHTISTQYTEYDMNRLGGELRARADVGTDYGAGIEWYQPLFSAPRFSHLWAPVFIRPIAGFESQPVSLSLPGGSGRFRAGRPFVGMDAGIDLSNVAQITGGIEKSHVTATTIEGEAPAGQGEIRFDDSDFFSRITVDTLDKATFPREGVYFTGQFRNSTTALGSQRPNVSWDSGGVAFTSFGKHTFGAKAVYSTNIDTGSSTPALFPLGGFLRLSGFSEDALTGTERILGQLRYYYNAFGSLYLGTAVEWGGTWFSRTQISIDSGFWAGSGFIGIDTPLGPMYIGSSLASGNRFSQTFYLGHTF